MVEKVEKYASQKKWRENNPQADWAHSAFRSALRRGLIERQSCAVCGDPTSEGHHPDYSKPAEVVWLCRKCHKAEHRRLKCEGGE